MEKGMRWAYLCLFFFKSFKLIWEFYWNSPNGEVWSKNQVILSLSFKSTPEIMTWTVFKSS